MDKKTVEEIFEYIDNLTSDDLSKLEEESKEMEKDYKINQTLQSKWEDYKKSGKL